jgi:FkbM family methyltransferase
VKTDLIFSRVSFSFGNVVRRLTPLKVKIFIKKVLSRVGILLFETSGDHEEICPSSTFFPGLGEFKLPVSFKFFDWYYPNCEMNSKRWIFENARESWNIIDVGANIGVYSILFGTLAKSGKVFALEPTKTIELLQENIDYHQLINVNVVNLALSDHTGVKSEAIYKIWGKSPVFAEYAFSTLDAYVEKLNLDHLDLVKIDTDGFEVEVLQGASFTLEKFNPWIMIELSGALNTRAREVGNLIEVLVGLGYKKALLLDSQNLVTKKSLDILESWSTSLEITPHEYPNWLLKKSLHVSPDRRLALPINNIKTEDFFNKFGINELDIAEKTFPRLPQRGHRMEVNDAPILSKLYQVLDSKKHLEFGTWEGYGTALFCANSLGYVTTINLPGGEPSSDKLDFPAYPSSLYPARRELFSGLKKEEVSDSARSVGWIYSYLGYDDRVTQLLCDSRSLSVSNFKDKFDSIFIDGGHDASTVRHDTELALKLISEDGVLIWHDFSPIEEERREFNSTAGVYAGLLECENLIASAGLDLYWIEDSWLLLGFKQSIPKTNHGSFKRDFKRS